MDRFHAITVFIAVVETQGFARAARQLHLSPPAVTRAVSELENHLGVKLLHRTTRHVRVTEPGQKYYEDAKLLMAMAEEADDAVAGTNAEPKGQVRITASVLFGRLYITEGIISYLKRYPLMHVDALFVDRVVNMMEEGVDVAIRIGKLPDSSYRAIPVGSIRRVLCASQDYLGKYGIPKSPDELSQHAMILSRGLNPGNDISFFVSGKNTSIRVDPVLTVSDNLTAQQAAEAGLGITRLLSYQIAESLKTGSMKILLSDYEHEPVPVHVVHREGRFSSARVRSLIDWMVDHLRSQTSLN